MSMFGRRKPAGGVPGRGGSGPAAGSADREDLATGTSSVVDPGTGPHDRADVSDIEAYYATAGYGYMDLGAMVVGIPPGRELNVTLAPTGVPEFHVVSSVSRVIPHVFAAPKSAGQWRSWVTDLRTSLEEQNADVEVVDGPWGRELAADVPGAVFRAIGYDGPRWMVEVRVMSTPENADQAAEEAREVMRHLIVSRGTDPMPVREHLPITVPDEVQQALVQAQGQIAEQQRAQAYAEQMAAAQQQADQQPDRQAPFAQEQPSDASAPRRGGSAMDSLRSDDL